MAYLASFLIVVVFGICCFFLGRLMVEIKVLKFINNALEEIDSSEDSYEPEFLTGVMYISEEIHNIL